MRLLPLCIVLVFAAHAGAAHEFWIAPTDYTLTADQPLVAELRVGQGFAGDTFPYLPPRFQRFDVIGGGETLPIPGRIGDDPAINVSGLPAGLLVLSYVSMPSSVTYDDAEVYDRFLREEGLEFAAARNVERGLDPVGLTEQFTRYSKSLVAVGDGRGEDRRLGLKVEIVADGNPYADDLVDSLPVQVFRDDDVYADALVRVLTKAGQGVVTETRFRTDPKGRVTVPIRPGSDVLVSSVALDEEAGEAQWHSHWASLTFHVPYQ